MYLVTERLQQVKYTPDHRQIKTCVATDRSPQGARPLFHPEEDQADAKHTRYPQEGREREKGPGTIREYQPEVRQVGERKGRAIDQGSPPLSDRGGKATVHDPAEEKLLPDRTEYHARDRHDRKQDSLIGRGDGIRNGVGLADVDVPVLDGIAVQTNADRIQYQRQNDPQSEGQEQSPPLPGTAYPDRPPPGFMEKKERHQGRDHHDRSDRTVVAGLIGVQHQQKPGYTDDQQQEQAKSGVEVEAFLPEWFEVVGH